MIHHVYFAPGMFGFGRLGSYNYFAHVERELGARFAAAGHELRTHIVDELPTASLRRRATRLAEIVAETADGDGPIHLVGHSTGGLDARLVASPATRTIAPGLLAWLPRLSSITTMNTPHYGTPLASFFTTASGQRVLYALSILTYTVLSLGVQPLGAASVILGFLQRGDRGFPLKIRILDRAVASVLGLIDDARSPDVRVFLAAIEDDQGSMLQLSPESMDLFVAGFEDRPGVRYQSTASMAPAPAPRRWIESLGHPWRALSLSLFFALHRITAHHGERYPCAAIGDDGPFAGEQAEAMLAAALGAPPTLEDNDGVVPIRSQVWGELLWAGKGDHLDVLGHYRDDREDMPAERRHRDWLTSGSAFGHRELAVLMDAIAAGMLHSIA